MCICDYCKEPLSEYDDYHAVVNEGFEDEKHECNICHEYNLDNGITTMCECCGMYFTPDHLKINSKNGLQEICPYCGEVWCE